MIHVFHGFLGSPADFSFLPSGAHLKIHDLRSGTPDFKPEENDVLIGYSMGGRIALELAASVNFRLKKLILINAHPGLASEKEKEQRRAWEDEILSKMSGPGFMNEWNALPIFVNDRPLSALSPLELVVWSRIFDRFRLSKQMDYLPACVTHKEKVLWLIGEKDHKYRALAEKELAPKGITYRLVEGGHRLFQSPSALMSALTQEGIL